MRQTHKKSPTLWFTGISVSLGPGSVDLQVWGLILHCKTTINTEPLGSAKIIWFKSKCFFYYLVLFLHASLGVQHINFVLIFKGFCSVSTAMSICLLAFPVGSGTLLLLHSLQSTSLLMLYLSSACGITRKELQTCLGWRKSWWRFWSCCRPVAQGFISKVCLKYGQWCKCAHRPAYRILVWYWEGQMP